MHVAIMACAFACLLSSCTARRILPPAGQSPAVLGNGAVLLAPPAGTGWRLVLQDGREVLYRKNASSADASPDPHPYIITAGAALFSRDLLPNRQHGLSPEDVRRLLSAQMNNFRREMVELDASAAAPDRFPGVQCISYRAVQVDRYLPESTEPRYRFSHRGLFCRVPDSSLQIVQLLHTEQFAHAWEPPPARASLNEADAFLSNVRFGQ
jgi:hypothetical protein